MRDLHVCMQQLASIIYDLGLACFDHDRKNTFVSNLPFIAAYSEARNFRIFITSDILAAINFRGCTLTAKPANLNRAK